MGGREPKFEASSAGNWEIGYGCRGTERKMDMRSIKAPLSLLLIALLWKGRIGADGRGREKRPGKGSLLTSMKNRAALEVGWLLM